MSRQTAGQTANFYWEKNALLGKGTCGTVYKGLNKSTGEPVAVKTFNDTGFSRSLESQTRELDVISSVSHINIVKLLAIEKEEDGGKPTARNVIIMELCAGGSLAKILEDPENGHGLNEDEYLLFLEHLTNGMKYLRENKMVHRDLKPGNLMRFIRDDGGSIYKLADFDAARQLDEGQEFMSLYGTEDYLHPDMYEQAWLSPVGQASKKFSECVDLWSIGVTLYHIATGELPFKPFMIRRDRERSRKARETMHMITTQKASGVISGHQVLEDGGIRWRDRLPKSCLLSPALKKLITPMLAGLMEVDKRIRWDFARFFSEAKNIVERKRLHIFHVNQVTTLRVYLEPEKSYEEFQAVVQDITGISPQNQTLLYKDSTLISISGTGVGSTIPITSPSIPIFLCDKENHDVKPIHGVCKHFFKSFPNVVNKFEDEKVAAFNCTIAHAYKRQIDEICSNIDLLNSTVLTMNQVIVSQLMGVVKENVQIKSVMRSMSNQFEMMKGFHTSCEAFQKCIPTNRCQNNEPSFPEIVNAMGKTYDDHLTNFLRLGDDLFKLKPAIDQLFGNRVENRTLLVEWEERAKSIPGIGNVAHVGATAANMMTKLRTSYDNLCVKPFTSVSPNAQAEENQTVLHLTERLRMREKCHSIAKLLLSEYNDVMVPVVGIFSDWFESAHIALIQPEILTKNLTELRVELSKCETDLSQAVKEFQMVLTGFTESLQKVQLTSSLRAASVDVSIGGSLASKSMRSRSNGFNKALKEKLEVREELEVLCLRNLEISRQFANLLETDGDGNTDSLTSP